MAALVPVLAEAAPLVVGIPQLFPLFLIQSLLSSLVETGDLQKSMLQSHFVRGCVTDRAKNLRTSLGLLLTLLALATSLGLLVLRPLWSSVLLLLFPAGWASCLLVDQPPPPDRFDGCL